MVLHTNTNIYTKLFWPYTFDLFTSAVLEYNIDILIKSKTKTISTFKQVSEPVTVWPGYRVGVGIAKAYKLLLHWQTATSNVNQAATPSF